MKAHEIMFCFPINSTDPEKVSQIANSIKKNGWVGAPILVCLDHNCLVTGSHRLAALEMLAGDGFDIDSLGDIAEPVDDLIDKWCEENDTTIDDIRYDYLSEVFAGTWVEQYKNDIAEL